MTPRQFLAEVCAPSVCELNGEPTSVRRAWLAVVSLFHLSDYLAADCGEALGRVRQRIYDDFPNFRLVRDIANASKHFEVDRGPFSGLSAHHVTTGHGAAFSDGSYYSDGTSHSDAPIVVRVEFNGHIVDIPHLCSECLNYFQRKLEESPPPAS